MKITYDHTKNEKNIRERGLDFRSAAEFRFDTADIRSVWKNGEQRFAATGFLNKRLHVLIFIETVPASASSASEKRTSGKDESMSKADAIWNKGPELIDDDGEVRELTEEDFKTFLPFSELDPQLQEKLLAINRGPNTFHAVEDTVQVPLPKSTARRMEQTGLGWEDRVDEVLREWLDKQKAS